jgi:hypothetical protein
VAFAQAVGQPRAELTSRMVGDPRFSSEESSTNMSSEIYSDIHTNSTGSIRTEFLAGTRIITDAFIQNSWLSRHHCAHITTSVRIAFHDTDDRVGPPEALVRNDPVQSCGEVPCT